MSKKLSFCLRAVKTLDNGDLDQLTQMIEDYNTAGMPIEQAEEAAVNDILRAVAGEREEITGLLRTQHPELFSILSNPTAQGLREKAEAAKKAEAADKAEQKRLADKAKADAEVGEFKLTGSDRAADAPDQMGLPGLSAGVDQTDTEAFKRWSNDAPVVRAGQAMTYEFKTGKKVVVEAFHGTKRPDRVGAHMKKSRSTSGPMPYHTSNPEIASNYATGKQDTSLSMMDSPYASWFKVKVPGARNPVNIDQAWYSLPADVKTTIAERMPDIRQNDALDVIYEQGGGDIGSYDYELEQTKRSFDRLGNPLKAATETWLNGGTLFGREEEFMQVLKLAGMPMDQVEFDSPHAEYPYVYKNWVAMQAPLVTDQVPEEVADALNAMAKRDRSRADQVGADAWDKNTRTPREWVSAFNEPDNQYVWTSIPDKITKLFQEFGYDGIIDVGGKGGGTRHKVYVPFEENQVKSAIGNKGKFDASKKSLNADFSGDFEQIPTGEAMEVGPVPAGNAEALATVQDAYRGAVKAFENLELTALPEVSKPSTGASQATKERFAAQEFAKLFGNRVGYFSSNIQRFAEGVAPLGKDRVLFINEATSRPVMAVMGHELTHSMRISHPGLYKKFDERMQGILKNPEKHDAWLATMYASRGIPALDSDKLREELYADIVGDVFTDPKATQQMLRDIAEGQPGLFQRVLAFIRDFLNDVLAKLKNERPYATGRYLNDVEAARDAVVATMKEFARSQQAAQQPRAADGTFTVEKRVAEPAMASANADPFYSELARQVEQAPMKSAPAAGWLQWLKSLGSKGVKPDEIAWTGIEDWIKLQQGKVTRDQVSDYLKANGVRVDEVMHTGDEVDEPEEPDLRVTDRTTSEGEWNEDEQMYEGDGTEEVTVEDRTSGETFTLYIDREAGNVTVQGAGGRFIDLATPMNSQTEEDAMSAIREDLRGSQPPPSDALPTKYGSYTLPGGKNYTELLLTLPPAERKPLFDVVNRKQKSIIHKAETREAAQSWIDANQGMPAARGAEVVERASGQAAAPEFKSGHWEQPNILAHIRFNERTDAEGKRVLFIEEIQSDWAQQGKKAGFIGDQTAKKYEPKVQPGERRELIAKMRDRAMEIMEESGVEAESARSVAAGLGHDTLATMAKMQREYQDLLEREDADRVAEQQATTLRAAVPAAPFVTKTDAWVGLAVKRMIRYAAENGFDRVAFVNGDQSADRYDLSKHIKDLTVTKMDSPGIYFVMASGLDSRLVVNQTYEQSELPDVIGKELADKAVAAADAKAASSQLTELPDGYTVSMDRKADPEFPFTIIPPGQVHGRPYAGRHASEEEAKAAALVVLNSTRKKGATFNGLDLKVGGEGMRTFYDKIVPKVVKDVIKKIGGDGIAKVTIDTQGRPEEANGLREVREWDGPELELGEVLNAARNNDLPSAIQSQLRDIHDRMRDGVPQAQAIREWGSIAAARALGGDLVAKPTHMTSQLGFDITPKMRDAAGAGLPMFSLAPNPTPPREGLARAFQRKLQDSFNRFTVIKNWAAKQGTTLAKDSDVWAYEERMHGRIATRVQDFREKRVKPAIQAIQKAGYSMEQVAEFLHAQHAEERNKQIETIDPNTKDGSGMSTADARAILARTNPRLVALANDFRKITDETRDTLLNAGIISQDMVDAWQKAYSSYVPLKGGDEEPAGKTGTGKGLNVAGKQKRALGHGARSEHIIENIMRDHERAITLSEKNRVGHALLGFVTDLANPEVATIGKPEKRKVLVKGTNYEVKEQNGARIGIFDTLPAAKKFLAFSQANGLLAQFGSPLTIEPVRADPSVAYMASPQLADNEVNVYVDGHTVRVQLNDELLARAYTRSGVERLNQVMALNREINNFLSKAYTGYNPEFFFTNVIRDFTTGLVNVTGQFGGKVTARAVKNYPKAFASLIRYSVTGKETPEIKDYRAAGGSTGSAYLSDIDRIGRDIQNSYDDYRGTMATLKGSGTIRGGRVAARKMAGSILQVMEHLNSAGESAMRLSVFEAVRTTPGYSDDDAASAAKNATVNFNRRGEWGPVMGAMYLFFNPAVQGTAAMMDAAVNGKHKWQARALLATLPALAYALSMQFAGGDDDEEIWKAIPDSTKDKNLIIRTGPKSYITIPVPYGPGFLFSLGNSLRSLQLGEDVDKVSLNVASSMLEHFSPIGNPLGGNEAETRGLVELIPGAVGGEIMRNAVRLAANRSGLGGDIIPDSPFDTGKPDNLKMFRSTKGSIYEKVAKWANAKTGGTAALPGAVDVSPESLKFWVRAITGGSGAFLVDSTTLGANAVRYAANPNDPDRAALKPEKSELPIVRRFLKDETIGNRRQLFWQAVKEVEKAEANLERARKLDDEEGMERVEAQHAELLAMGGYTDDQKKAIKAQRDAVEEVMADTATSLAYKRARVKELEAEEIELYNEYVREFTLSKRAERLVRSPEGATP